jgi:hypothetical protein
MIKLRLTLTKALAFSIGNKRNATQFRPLNPGVLKEPQVADQDVPPNLETDRSLLTPHVILAALPSLP